MTADYQPGDRVRVMINQFTLTRACTRCENIGFSPVFRENPLDKGYLHDEAFYGEVLETEGDIVWANYAGLGKLGVRLNSPCLSKLEQKKGILRGLLARLFAKAL